MTRVTVLDPPVTDAQLNERFAAAWPGHTSGACQRVLARSLAYCAAFDGDALVGYANVAWHGTPLPFKITDIGAVTQLLQLQS